MKRLPKPATCLRILSAALFAGLGLAWASGALAAEAAPAAASAGAGWSPAYLWPGLWLLVLAVVLDQVLRRVFDPVPLRVWGFFAVPIVAVFGGVLFGGETFLPVGDIQRFPVYEELGLEILEENYLQRDLTHAITPWQAAVRRAYAAGEWPLWNTSSGAGVPLLANPQAMSLHPLVLAAFPVSLPGALGLVGALRVLVAFVFTFLLLRRQGLSEPPAILGGVAYGLGGFMMLWLGWPHTNSAAMVPVLLYATLIWSQERRRRDLVLVTLSLFGTFTTGHPETALYVLTFGGCFALARIRASGDARWKVFRGWAAGAVLGGLLAAPLLLPAAAYLPETNRYAIVQKRAERLTSTFLLSQHWKGSFFTAHERILPALTPNAWGNNQHGEYWGYHNINEAAGGFVGTLTFFAALLAIWPKIRRRLPQERFMLWTLVVCGIVLLRPPLFMELTLRLPPFDKSPNFHGRSIMILGFALAYLAACTLERWLRDGLPRLRTALTAAAVGGLVLWTYLAHPYPEDPSHLADLRYTSMGLHLATLAVGTAALLALSRPRRQMAGAALVVGLVAVELLVLHGGINTPAPRDYFYPPSPPLTYMYDELHDDPEGHRMVALHASLPPEFAAVYDLPDLRALGPSVPLRVSRLFDPLRSRPRGFLFHVPDHPVLDLVGTRFVLSEGGRELGPPLEAVFRDPNGIVWERPNPLPRLFLPRSTVLLAETPGWRKWTAANPSFLETSIVLPTPEQDASWSARRPRASRLEMAKVARTHVQARADLAEPRLVASGTYQDGGWHLLVDGERRPTTLANGPLVAAWVPGGEHRIDLVYRPPGFLAGMILAALALAGLLVIAVPPPGRTPGSPAPAG